MILTLEQAKALLAALQGGDAESAMKIIADAIAAAVADESAEGAGAAGDTPALAEPLSQTAEPSPAPDAVVPPKEKTPADNVKAAALTKLVEVTGCDNLGEAVVVLTKMIVDQSAGAVLEIEERKGLVGKLVKLGAEDPATAWEGDPALLKPVKWLSDMPISDLRKRVTHFASRPGAPKIEPPASKSTPKPKATVALSADVLAAIKAKGLTEDEFIAMRDGATKRST